MIPWSKVEAADREDLVDTVLMLIDEAGGQADTRRFSSRPPGSHTREAFGECVKRGYVDAEGWMTPIGQERRLNPADDLVLRGILMNVEEDGADA